MSVPARERDEARAGAERVAPPAAAGRLDPTAAHVIALQQTAGNRAVAGLIARAPTFLDRVGMFFGKKTYLATVAGEEVHVASEAEEKDAARIIAAISSTYGIDVSSVKAMKALKGANKSAPKDLVDKIAKRPWLYKELQAIERALAHYAPILGKARAGSTRAAAPQELVAVGKLEERLGEKAGKTVFKPTVMGTYFSASQTFAMYKHGETATPDFSDIDKQIEGTAIHEIAHGIFQYAEADFVKTFDYWLDEDTASGKKGAEPPPTDYGQTSAAEDLAECAMLYFLDRPRLEKDCPLRTAFMDKLVKGWEPEPLKGGWPEQPKDAETAIA
ncbi:MAG: hypothetical protein QOC68_3940 [Solirubrobacteraceae bacterium]|nr:hypothetical protein [Solirubrobacteraceae bacterium]